MRWMKLREICRNAVLRYGTLSQLVVAMEECAELQKECAKSYRYLRYGFPDEQELGNKYLKEVALQEHLAEEIADVEIMLMQLKVMFNLDYDVNRYRDIKAERLAERLENAGK